MECGGSIHLSGAAEAHYGRNSGYEFCGSGRTMGLRNLLSNRNLWQEFLRRAQRRHRFGCAVSLAETYGFDRMNHESKAVSPLRSATAVHTHTKTARFSNASGRSMGGREALPLLIA